MLLIHHKGIHVSLDLDTTSFTGDVEHDAALTYVTGLTAGRMAGIASTGKVQLGDGDPANGLHALGFIVNDAKGAFFMNKPAIASKEVAITFSPCMISTDQVPSGFSCTIGQKLYCGTGANVGLVVASAPAGTSRPIGIAMSDLTAQGDVTSGSLSIAPGVPMVKILVGAIAD